MKSAYLIALLVSLATADSLLNIDVSERLTGDFLTGFESGLFMLHKNSTEIEKLHCPEQHLAKDNYQSYKMLITSFKMMMNSMSSGIDQNTNETRTNICESVEMFIDGVDQFIGVFDKDYPGGDFCAGVTFGAKGAQWL
jgi:hypothetical protein